MLDRLQPEIVMLGGSLEVISWSPHFTDEDTEAQGDLCDLQKVTYNQKYSSISDFYKDEHLVERLP